MNYFVVVIKQKYLFNDKKYLKNNIYVNPVKLFFKQTIIYY